jgi:hypothetical protein
MLVAIALLAASCDSFSGGNNVSAADLQKRQQAMAASDHLIVPGQRIGPIHLGMGMDEALRTMGQPDRSYMMKNSSGESSGKQSWNYDSLNLSASFSDSSAPVVTEIITSAYGKPPIRTAFKTANGIGLGASSFDVKRAYSLYKDSGDSEALYYRSIGIIFDLEIGTFRISEINVFPGN